MLYRLIILTFFATVISARAATPAASAIQPTGSQRGTEVDITITGDRLADAKELFFYEPGITVTKLEAPTPQQITARLQIAADAPLGEHVLRVRTASGISDVLTFHVGPFPTTAEAEPNTAFDQPQPISLNVTVSGIVANEDVDHFVVEARQGQRITAEIEAFRLGINFFDPYVAILDEERFELSASDDTALHLQDSVASVVAPRDGKYVIQVRDSAYGGNESCQYRLHVGTYPRPRAAVPAGGQVGQELALQWLGDVAGAFPQTIKLPDQPRAPWPAIAVAESQIAPSPNLLRVSPFANVVESEPNNDREHATIANGDLPLAFNGAISEDGDQDFFKFTAKQGQVFDFSCYARRLRTPLDSVVYLFDANGAQLAANDDAAGPDSIFRFTIPTDGDYYLLVHDHLHKGSPDAAYRVEVTAPEAVANVSIPPITANSQERQTVVVPRGNRFATLVRVARADFGGSLAISAANLPVGVTTQSEPMADNLDIVPIVFEAAGDAPIAGSLADLSAAHVDPNVKVRSDFSQAADLIVGLNQVAFYQAKMSKLAVAVADAAPFHLEVVQPKAPLVQNGSTHLKVVAKRKEGFTGAINVQLLFAPPGVGTQGASIPDGQNEVLIPLSAAGDAQVRKWKTCVIGYADVNGPLWVSTPLFDLDVAAPLIAARIEMAAGEQGKDTQVLCTLEQKTPFEGKARIQLVGLPPNTTAPEMEIAATDTQVIFPVAIAAAAPVGQHNSLMCIITPIKDGEPVIHNTGHGGVLRIDAPPPPVADAPAAAPEPAPSAAEQAPILSRLEKLRQDQAMKATN
jgi:hypothetical protein